MISFIVSAYKRPEMLRTCLSSIAAQTYTDWEAIVTDNTPWTEQWKNVAVGHLIDKRIKHLDTGYKVPDPSASNPEVRHTKCLYTAAELGVEQASGEWLAFPNDDTAYPPVFAERMIEHAERHGLDLVYCDLVLGGPDIAYHFLEVRPWPCSCDKTAFIVKAKWFEGFPNKERYSVADGLLLESLVQLGIKHGRLAECLIVHN